MIRVCQLLAIVSLAIANVNSHNGSSCIINTSCQCYFTQHSLKLLNCSHALPDLPIFNSKNTNNITKIIAPSSLSHWPLQLCQYSNLQILDLSGSYFDSEFIDLSCLTNLIHLNLSNTQLTKIPKFKKDFFDHLQILDLSNNRIRFVDGIHFQSLTNLISLNLQNNPIEYIDHLEYFFNMTNLETIDLISSNLNVELRQISNANQWTNLAQQWNNSRKPFYLRMKNIALQSMITNLEQLPIDSMKVVLKTLINSTFATIVNTPKCDCLELRRFQRVFLFVDHQKKYSSPLFQSTTCLMPDGITHSRLFDRRTYIDLRCPLLGKISSFPLAASSSSSVDVSLGPFLLFYFYSLN